MYPTGGYGAAASGYGAAQRYDSSTALSLDIIVKQRPTDTVTGMAFSPTAELLAASSWDGKARIWEVQQTGQVVQKFELAHQAPVLSCAWNHDGSKMFSVGCDRQVRASDIQTGQSIVLGQHQAPIQACRWAATAQYQMLVTGSWDKTLKYWDLRSPDAALTVNMPERVYALDCLDPILVTLTAQNKPVIFNMADPSRPFRVHDEVNLRHQQRCIAVLPTRDSYCVGSIEGRVAVNYIDPNSPQTFSFRCHRDGANVYAVNCIAARSDNQFLTCGSDGCFIIWDRAVKRRAVKIDKLRVPVTSGTFNRNGSILAYALGPDYHAGPDKETVPATSTNIYLHPLTEIDVTPVGA